MIEHHPTAEELKWFEPTTISPFSAEALRLAFGNPSDRQNPQDSDKSRETYEMTPGSLAHRDLMRRLAEPDNNRKSAERSDKVTNLLPDVYIDF